MVPPLAPDKALAPTSRSQPPRSRSSGRLRLTTVRLWRDESTAAERPRLRAAPLRDGEFAICLEQSPGSPTLLLRFDAEGRLVNQHHLSAPASEARLLTTAGFAALGGDGFALAFRSAPRQPAPGTQTNPARLVLGLYSETGALRDVIADVLEPLPRTPPLSAWQPGAPLEPAPAANIRLAYGDGHLCVHLPQRAPWADGSFAQGGFARSLRVAPTTRARRTAGPGLVDRRPWFGSRSLDQRCTYDATRGCFALASLSDGFPRGILLSRLGAGSTRDQVLQFLPGTPGQADIGAELGDLVALRESYAQSFTSSVAAQPESRDVFVAFAMPDLQGTPLIVRVTGHAPGTYAFNPRMALLGRHLLVAWNENTPLEGRSRAMVAVVTSQAQLMLGPQPLFQLPLSPGDEFVTDSSGAVNWFSFRDRDLFWQRVRFARGPSRTAQVHEQVDSDPPSAASDDAPTEREGRRP